MTASASRSIEPASQVAVFQGRAGLMVLLFSAIFAFNLLQVGFFSKFGFLAPLTMRLAYYMIWHITGGALPL